LTEDALERRFEVDHLGVRAGEAVDAAAEGHITQHDVQDLADQLRRIGVVAVDESRVAVGGARCRQGIRHEGATASVHVVGQVGDFEDLPGLRVGQDLPVADRLDRRHHPGLPGQAGDSLLRVDDQAGVLVAHRSFHLEIVEGAAMGDRCRNRRSRRSEAQAGLVAVGHETDHEVAVDGHRNVGPIDRHPVEKLLESDGEAGRGRPGGEKLQVLETGGAEMQEVGVLAQILPRHRLRRIRGDRVADAVEGHGSSGASADPPVAAQKRGFRFVRKELWPHAPQFCSRGLCRDRRGRDDSDQDEKKWQGGRDAGLENHEIGSPEGLAGPANER